jgi:hypothetical protein
MWDGEDFCFHLLVTIWTTVYLKNGGAHDAVSMAMIFCFHLLVAIWTTQLTSKMAAPMMQYQLRWFLLPPIGHNLNYTVYLKNGGAHDAVSMAMIFTSIYWS